VKPLKAREILASLERHQVDYVLIGGLGAVLQGSPLPTLDADICPARSPENLERTAAALRELGARIRTEDVPDGLAFACDAAFLANVQLLNLTTPYGNLDLSYSPSGTGGFEDLAARAVLIAIGDLTVRVAHLEDIIRSKEAANRPKDHRTLPVLKRLLQEIQARERDQGSND
jgi:hypothetical protein